jgi:formylglycine-generating enzyme required for sulfatase activity
MCVYPQTLNGNWQPVALTRDSIPGGNAFDASRANVVGLSDKGQKYDSAPVDAFPNGRSPFGLLDTVGNAGDWIDSRGGHERTLMGGTYRFDKENTLTYSSMPGYRRPFAANARVM